MSEVVKIYATSDLHGYLPDIPDCDILLLGGDYCPTSRPQHFWFRDEFKPWINNLARRMTVVGVAGNHDWMFEVERELIPKMNWHYLEDSAVTVKGLKIYGSPHQPRFFDWAFNLDEPDLEKKWAMIPDDTDILVLHGPPHGYGDVSHYPQPGMPRELAKNGIHVGSPSLLKRIQEVKPKLAIAGHIHPGFGEYQIGDTKFLNVSFVNERYIPKNQPVYVEILVS